MSKKWFESPAVDVDVIVSTRVRLARNLAKFPFPAKLSEQKALAMIDEVKAAVFNDRTAVASQFVFAQLNDIPEARLNQLMERHLISREMLIKKAPKALISSIDENIAVMLNEEDHIRIQTIFAGDNMDKAFELAMRVDDLIGESAAAAFDERYGYLTSCPTNTGTGLRASYMLHLPAIVMSGRLNAMFQSIAQYGMTMRGIHGEGTEPLGCMYQLSNQITLGKSESETIESLQAVAKKLCQQEKLLRDRIYKQRTTDLVDKIYRSYGTLKYARQIKLSEAMNLLSDVRLGYQLGIIKEEKPTLTLYHIMMNIQHGSLNGDDEETARAYYIRSIF